MNKKKIAYFTLLFCFILSVSWAQQNNNNGRINSENNSSLIVTECSVEENNTPVTMISLLTVTSTIEITEDIPISDINVAISITHTYMGDVTLTLESPFGTIVTLIDGECLSSENMEATFDDSGVVFSCAEVSPGISGIIIPKESLLAFNGESSLGTWTLRASDSFPPDEGTLNSWGIEYCSGTVLSTDRFNEFNIVMYPNPATDIVSIKFDTMNELEVTLFDVLGRKVLSQMLAKDNNGVDVSKLASGSYTVQMQNKNNEKIIKTLIIE